MTAKPLTLDQAAHSLLALLTGEQTVTALWEQTTRMPLGLFQDAVRALHATGAIRLSPWTRAYGMIANERAPLFLDGEVMYFVRKA